MKNEELKLHIKDRAFDFSVRIVKMVREMSKDPAGYALASQIVRSGTSIGANIEEAQGAISKKEFIHSMQIALKEARETFYWIKVIRGANLLNISRTDLILKESMEILKILTTIVKHAKLVSRA
jgi:four helix bundle protein